MKCKEKQNVKDVFLLLYFENSLYNMAIKKV